MAELHGAQRPPWTPQGDPRLVALAESFGLLIAVGDKRSVHNEGGPLCQGLD